MKNLFTTIILLVAILFVNGQERLVPLNENSILKNQTWEKGTERMATLELPFFDDFYPLDIYPDANLWEDNLVFVNATMPVSPPTIGVATFDGLNADGNPYSIVANDYGVADLLTSMPINLEGLMNDDDVYLSFFWQPQGLGEAPDFDGLDLRNQDYLIVEFKDSIGNWDTLWSVMGDTIHPFKQEFIQVVDSFLHDDFQFRFKSVARLTGALDHWHVDYVKLDKLRDPIIEQNIPELAYQYLPSSLLDPYYVMPYNQFDSSYVADTHSVYIRNNFVQATTDIIDFYTATELSTSTILEDYSGPSADIGPLNDFIIDYDKFEIPTTFSGDTLTIQVDYSFLVSAEDTGNTVSIRNNRIVKDQVFNNFYAYDDGSAERAYALEVRSNDALYGRAALKYETITADTLQALKLHLANINFDVEDLSFSIYVWKGLESDSTEEEILYFEEDIAVVDLPPGDPNGNINNFSYIPIRPDFILSGDSELLIEGDFYIGYEIGVNVDFPVGWDMNTDGSDFHYYDFGLGWFPTLETGSLMFNPVFGVALPDEYVLDNNETILASFDFQIFPNPVHSNLKIQSSIKDGQISIIDMMGREVLSTSWNKNGLLDVKQLTAGVYILRVRDTESGLIASKQFIKQ